jgi:hypothetical protein
VLTAGLYFTTTPLPIWVVILLALAALAGLLLLVALVVLLVLWTTRDRRPRDEE